MSASKAIAVIAGVGPGTGAACARRFAKAYPVVLLARSPENFEPLVKEINGAGGRAMGVSTDVSSEESVKAAFKKIDEEFGGGSAKIVAAVFNASGPFKRKPFLEMGVDEFKSSWSVSVQGALIFSQAVLPRMQPLASTSATDTANYPPTLIFTGATASIKANAQMSGFAAPKFAMRALSTSLAKEFAPQGIHIAHAVIDGVIDIPRTRDWLKDMPPEAKIGADDIAEAYWNLHTQGKRCFTNEIDIRPMLEKW